jgi:hypothetical protein
MFDVRLLVCELLLDMTHHATECFHLPDEAIVEITGKFHILHGLLGLQELRFGRIKVREDLSSQLPDLGRL